MKSKNRLSVRLGSSFAPDEQEAVAELRDSVFQEDAALVLFFCSSAYHLPRLAEHLRAAFPGSLIGCTSAGQIGPQGFSRGGITAVSMAGDLQADPYAILDLNACHTAAAQIGVEAAASAATPGFGLILVDGLSLKEEQLAAALYQSLGHVPIVGGSAGDDLAFRKTHIFADGEFHSDAAVFTLFRTPLPFTTFKFAHFVPTTKRVVITRSDPTRRVVYEINGMVASEAYAATLGLAVDQLNEHVFSRHPLVLELGGEQYIRSIQQVHQDGSFTLLSAIEDGVVLSIGQSVNPVETAMAAFRGARAEVGEVQLILGCDCIQRRLDCERSGLLSDMGQVMANNKVIGFSTYGEQYNAVHVNQTFTGVAIGV